jgi:hypothetical protein
VQSGQSIHPRPSLSARSASRDINQQLQATHATRDAHLVTSAILPDPELIDGLTPPCSARHVPTPDERRIHRQLRLIVLFCIDIAEAWAKPLDFPAKKQYPERPCTETLKALIFPAGSNVWPSLAILYSYKLKRPNKLWSVSQ